MLLYRLAGSAGLLLRLGLKDDSCSLNGSVPREARDERFVVRYQYRWRSFSRIPLACCRVLFLDPFKLCWWRLRMPLAPHDEVGSLIGRTIVQYPGGKRAEFRLMDTFGELPGMTKEEVTENKMIAYLDMYQKPLFSQAIPAVCDLVGMDGKAKMDFAKMVFSDIPAAGSPLDNGSP